MHAIRTYCCLLLTGCLLVLAGMGAETAWAWGKKPLVVIDGQEYSADDYKQWWEYWRDTEKQTPEGVQPFVDWLLMVREADRMDLASLPEYKHKVEVFLETRSLMALKQEEIDAKIAIDDRMLQESYEQYYAPRRLIGVLEFPSMDKASAFIGQYAGQTLSPERLQAMAKEKIGPQFMFQHPQWLRPINTPVSWLPVLATDQPGTLRGPLPIGEKGEVLCVFEVKPGDKEDYAKKKESIGRKLRKQREQALTEQLVWALREKYHVRLDEKVLESINLDDPGVNDLAQVVIESERSKVTVGYFLEQSRKATKLTHSVPVDDQEKIRLKQMIANTMIANSLVSREALSRHYEEKEPLRGIYQFYLQNRLVVELGNRAPGDILVDDAEAKSYYQSHPNEFKQPETIRAVMVTGEEPVVKKVWAAAIGGAELVKAAERNGAALAISADRAVPIQHYSSAAQKALSGVKPGDMTQPFLDNGHSVVIKLIERTPETVAPFDTVAKDVKARLVAEKKKIRKKNLLDTLRSRSQIVVNDDMWAGIAAGYH